MSRALQDWSGSVAAVGGDGGCGGGAGAGQAPEELLRRAGDLLHDGGACHREAALAVAGGPQGVRDRAVPDRHRRPRRRCHLRVPNRYETLLPRFMHHLVGAFPLLPPWLQNSPKSLLF